MLPSLEQMPLYNAYNFSVNADSGINSTVTYSAIPIMSCPSDNQKVRPNTPVGATNYVANHGGPGVIRMWSGTIVEFLTCSVPGDQVNGWSPGTYWWGADNNLGFFGFESVTDGTANTGLFSEKLLGWSSGNNGAALLTPLPRHVAASTSTRTPRSPSTRKAQPWQSSVVACQTMAPGTVNNNGWLNGFSWAIGYEWYTVVNSYHHYNTPNKLTCVNSSDQGGLWGGTSGMSTASSNHSGGVNVCFTDGSVRFVKDTVGPPTWWALEAATAAKSSAQTSTESRASGSEFEKSQAPPRGFTLSSESARRSRFVSRAVQKPVDS